MRPLIRNIWKEGKGMGKGSFRFRMVAYPAAILLVIVHHIENNLPFTLLEYGVIFIFLLMPHIFLYRYVRSGNDLAQVIRDSAYDFFFVGIFIGVMNVSIIPSFVFALGVTTNYFSVRGLNKLYRLLMMPLGCIPILFIEDFNFHFDSSNLMLFLSLTYCAVHYCINAYILYFAANKVRIQNVEIEKQRQEILAQAEELKILNETLKDTNAGLEVNILKRAKELEIKNKKLEEYTFNNAHKLRAPVATILGLIQLLDYTEVIERERVLAELKKAGAELDKAIRYIREKLEEEN